jgi:hypothetical protein
MAVRSVAEPVSTGTRTTPQTTAATGGKSYLGAPVPNTQIDVAITSRRLSCPGVAQRDVLGKPQVRGLAANMDE